MKFVVVSNTPGISTLSSGMAPDLAASAHSFLSWLWQGFAPSNKIACGFAFIRRLEEPDLDYEIAEFCVFPPHRKRGFGTRVLPQLFARHPGRWEASVLMTNQSGLGFWPVALKRAQVQSLRYREDAIARDFRFEVG